jgi:hypothetical protein
VVPPTARGSATSGGKDDRRHVHTYPVSFELCPRTQRRPEPPRQAYTHAAVVASPTRPPSNCFASSAPTRASHREPPTPPDPSASPHRTARRGTVGGSTGTAKAWQPTGTGSSATGRPARGQCPLAGSADCPLLARRAVGGVPGAGSGTVSGTGRPFSRVREHVALPAGRGENKPSGGLPDSIYRSSL